MGFGGAKKSLGWLKMSLSLVSEIAEDCLSFANKYIQPWKSVFSEKNVQLWKQLNAKQDRQDRNVIGRLQEKGRL